MKFLLLFLLLFGVMNVQAQKYALLDMQLSRAVKYTDTITAEDSFDKYLPVEKKMHSEFLKVLREIEKG